MYTEADGNVAIFNPGCVVLLECLIARVVAWSHRRQDHVICELSLRQENRMLKAKRKDRRFGIDSVFHHTGSDIHARPT